MKTYTIIGGTNGVGKSSFLGCLNEQRDDLGVIVDEARDKNYCVRLYYIGISSAQESLLRIKNRVKKGGHGIPESDVLRRNKSRFEDLLRILPYCDEAQKTKID